LEEGEAEAENYPWAVAEVEVANRPWAMACHRTRKTNYFPRFVCDNRDNPLGHTLKSRSLKVIFKFFSKLLQQLLSQLRRLQNHLAHALYRILLVPRLTGLSALPCADIMC
jgi:hypothetical protein